MAAGWRSFAFGRWLLGRWGAGVAVPTAPAELGWDAPNFDRTWEATAFSRTWTAPAVDRTWTAPDPE